MPKKPIDAETNCDNSLHAKPVTLGDAVAKDDAFMRKVRNEALDANPPFDNLGELVAEMNAGRNSALVRNGNAMEVMSGSGKEFTLEQVVRERAYLLWEQAGQPEGRSDEFWLEAEFGEFREQAYALTESESCPEGKADEHRHRIRSREQS